MKKYLSLLLFLFSTNLFAQGTIEEKKKDCGFHISNNFILKYFVRTNNYKGKSFVKKILPQPKGFNCCKNISIKSSCIR